MTGDYEVGYGKPPKRSRFPKGASGNPKGCPKKVKSTMAQDLDEILAERVEFPVNGKVMSYTLKELIVEQLTEKAANGNRQAFKMLLLFREDIEKNGAFEPATIWLDEADRGF